MHVLNTYKRSQSIPLLTAVNDVNIYIISLIVFFVIRTLHDCPSQMNENLLISNSKLTSDSELIWWR